MNFKKVTAAVLTAALVLGGSAGLPLGDAGFFSGFDTAITASAGGGFFGVKDTSGYYTVGPANYTFAKDYYDYDDTVDFSKIVLSTMANYDLTDCQTQPGYVYDKSRVLPSEIDIPTKISYYFYKPAKDNTNLSWVKKSGTVTEINNVAHFYNGSFYATDYNSYFSDVKTIKVPNTVTKVKNLVFEQYAEADSDGNYSNGSYNKKVSPDNHIKSIYVPKSVKTISGEKAFGTPRDDLTIYVESGSEALDYCKKNGYNYKLYTYSDTSSSSAVSISKASFKFASTSIGFTGKAKMPKLTVTYKGKKLVKGTDYTVSLSNAKKVGKATAKITGIGKFKGTKKLTYYVVPAKSSISKVTSTAKKKMTVTWKKDTSATGYQIQVSLKKNFSSKKNYTVSKSSTAKASISKLTSGKTYYVRMRAYKTIDGSKKYGAFSAVKSVKVK